MSATLSPLFTWRTAIAKSGLPPTVRHVALTLSLYMNERGGSAWPSITTLAEDSGLSQASIKRGTKALERAGYLLCDRDPGRSTHYTATAPTQLTFPQEQVTQNRAQSEPGSQGDGGGLTLTPDPAQSEPLSSQEHVTTTTRTRTTLSQGFDEFWVTYPKRKGKGAARKAWGLAVKKAPAEVIVAGARRYFEDPNLPEPAYIPLPATWLNQERWDDDPEPAQSNGHKPDRFVEQARRLGLVEERKGLPA